MMPDIHHIPLSEIDAEALPRDRTVLDEAALSDLTLSIAAHGLRQPIEVFATTGDTPYGLISGFRRLTATRALGHDTIPAFLRTPDSGAAAMASMIEENEIRADITPWERAKIILTAIDVGLFDTLDAAIPVLFPTYDRFRRARLRAVAEVVAHFGDHGLSEPRSLSQKKLTRLAFALRAGMGEAIDKTLQHSSDRSPATQWRRILPLIEEAEEDARRTPPAYKPGRPRRFVHARPDLVIRRERAKDGWVLRFTGREASGPLMEDVMDDVENRFGLRQ